MKMIFSKEKYFADCVKNNYALNFNGTDWIEKLNGKEAIFVEGKDAGTCEGFFVLREWCEQVEEKSAREMFEAFGFEFEEDEKFIEYTRINQNERQVVMFYKEKKTFDAYDFYECDAMQIDGELLKAIVKQMEEMGAMYGERDMIVIENQSLRQEKEVLHQTIEKLEDEIQRLERELNERS